ncbi:gamma-butyrobetaine dioxygenase [Inquilinus ginsengisoli]|uniref:Gamma-butyrobetaine dioxygenase n=1 Tax=Inquilinus ginsengisoli TaxID=363840 RepID=A0ABU1JY31_9PROT|nr:HD domain-containing protein [Inquilinus ginsengisoli]MDR6293529.1 gamma-butyrobetaine dioxygenase [Inquilinus ginsengisoli]
MSDTLHPLLAEIEGLFAAHGHNTYGEGVTMQEHGLQAAALAEHEGAPDELVVAALLHDIGHFLELADDAYGYHKHDGAGGDWLAARFGPEISEPARLHVAAKRYLCAVEPSYLDVLSAASVHSLGKQGGPMSPAEVAEFARHPQVDAAVRLRRWDDGGKIEGLKVSTVADYRDRILKAAKAG